MLWFVQSWFSPGANPVGIDFGAATLRMAQVEQVNNDFQLVAAASAMVPEAVRNNRAARLDFYTASLRELWCRGNFRGRRARLSLPADDVHIEHVRLPRMDEAALKKAVAWEARCRFPADAANIVVRHIVAGEVFTENDPRLEVILLAARRDRVDELLRAAARARLDVVGIGVQPRAILDCFLNVYRRQSDAQTTHCYVDMGCGSSRATITLGDRIFFSRSLPVGTEHLLMNVARVMGVGIDQASRLAEAANDASQLQRAGESVPEPTTTASSRPAISASDAAKINDAMREPAQQIARELALCRRYHDLAFPQHPVQQLIFIGGGAMLRGACLTIARELGIIAKTGDPIARLARTAHAGIDSALDRRQPQPAWAAAIGLSMGAAVPAPIAPIAIASEPNPVGFAGGAS